MERTPHIEQRRLLTIAENDLRLEQTELEHMQDCTVCVAVFSKAILEVARSRARAKTKGQKAS